MEILNFLKPALCGVAMLLPFVSCGQGIYSIYQRTFNRTSTVPLGALPMLYNSSFAGESEGARLNSVFAFGHQEDHFTKTRNYSYHASFDQFIPALKSGIGITINRGTQQDLYKITSLPIHFNEQMNSASLAIAPKFSVKGKYTLSPSIDFSYGRGSLSADQPNNKQFYHDQFRGRHSWLQSRLGFLFNTDRYYIGYTTYVLNRHYHENERLSGAHDQFTSYVQAGYTFQRNAESKFSFTPQLAVGIRPEERGFFSIVYPEAINLNFRYERYIAGFNNTGLHLGLHTEKFRIMLSNRPWENDDSRFYENGNIALRYIFKN